MKFSFPVDSKDEKEFRSEVEWKKSDLDINNRFIDVMMSRCKYHGIHDQTALAAIRNLVSSMVLEQINPKIQDVLLDQDISKASRENYYMMPKRDRMRKPGNGPAFLEEINNAEFADLISSLISHLYGAKLEHAEFRRIKSVCVRNAIKHMSDIDIPRFCQRALNG